ncbi:DNA excision repair protein ERCC-5 homolog isoform X3 [Homalodisca vitripennis]|nr:DNA excision repair protein ERCC-5 homolog isoform X3 [Homalodisca vitripennis]
MARLLKRRSVQVSLEEAEKEMGGRTLSLGDVEALLAEGGIEINPQLSKRIASDEVTRYIYVTESGDQSSNLLSKQSSDPSITKCHKESSNSTLEFDPNIKIKEEIIDSDELSDVEFVREVEAIEAVHNIVKVEKEENNEYGTEHIFEDSCDSEGVIIDELDLVKDNSGLSQDQILAIIKQENFNKFSSKKKIDESIPSTSTNTSTFQESDMLDIKGVMNTNTDVVENSNNLKTNVTGLANSSKGSESNILDSLYFKFYNKKIQSALSQKSKLSVSSDITSKSIVKNQRSTRQRRLKCVDLPTLPSKSSSSDSENSQNLPCQIASVVLPDNTNSSVMKNSSSTKCDGTGQENDVSGVSENTVHLSSSESDSDFIDVPPSNGVDLCVPENKLNAQGLSIQINKDQNKIEDDIFADIFVDEKESAGKLVENINNPLPSNQIVKRSKDNLLEVKEDENKRTTKSTSIKIVQTSANLNSVSDESLTESFEEKQLSLEKEEEANVELNDARALLSNENEHFKTKLDVQDALIQQESEGSEDIDNPDLELKTPSKGVYKPEARSETSNSEALLESEPPKRKLNTKQLEKLQDILETKEREILLEQNREDRLASSMTDQMYQEAQELLRLFGVPYLVAPMEAEAQCAFMDAAGLTQGTITDDSDIWLFGGRKVYKNFFDQKKFVLEFQDNDIQHYFKLERSHLILLALLVGSDYTVGIQGVGPVTALEILATFPPTTSALLDSRDPQLLVGSLLQFREWWQSSASSHTYTQLAKKLKNIELHQGFPSPSVVSAYLQPLVDDSREPFSWGSPDLPGLRDYAEKKFGWSRNRVDQILLPVVNRLSQKSSQLTLHTFFGAVPNITAHREQMSKRVQTAVNRLEGGSENFQPSEPRPRQPRGRGRARGVVGGGARRGRGRALGGGDEDDREFIHESVGKPLEVIPQREKDRQEALKRKQQAIEILKKKKSKLMKKRRNLRQEKPEANLSESSSDD